MKTALIVDDSDYMRSLLKLRIARHGFTEVIEADNGITGVEKYKEFKPDIVFLDIMMEEMDGIDALKQILAFDPNANVIMASSVMGMQVVLDEAKAIGAKAFLVKPPDDKKIADVLSAVGMA